MKRLVALLLTAIVMCSLLVIPVSAVPNYVVSPEYDQEIEIPDDPTPEDPGPEIPADPGVDIPDEPVPESPATPTSPQTGYTMGILGLVTVTALCGSVAVVSGKKAFQC